MNLLPSVDLWALVFSRHRDVNYSALRWRHNGCDSVSNHQPHHCLLNRLFRRRSKKTSKLRVTGLCAGNSPGTGEFSAQMASNAENVSISWRHHGFQCLPWGTSITMTSQWARWRLNSPASRLFTQPFIQAHRNHKSSASLAFVWGSHRGPGPGTGKFPAQMASNVENVSIRWRHM